jgi:membrane protein implicated in regulation of membrane protease activity
MTVLWDALSMSASLLAFAAVGTVMLVFGHRFFAKPLDMQPIRAQVRDRQACGKAYLRQ